MVVDQLNYPPSETYHAQLTTVEEQNEGKRVAAVIPAFNEERFVASVVLKTRLYADSVILVDDGSHDNTALLAEAAGATVVRQKENQGKAEALKQGFRKALELGADAIVCLDADAQHDPSEIPVVVAPILADKADLVIGSRFLEVKSDIPRWRQMGQHTLTSLTNTLSGTKVTDSQSGFRAFSPEAALKLKFNSKGLSVESEMQFLLESGQVRVSEVPISVSYLDGNKRNPVVHGLEVIDSMLSLVARRRPLSFISLPGLVMGLLGFMLGIHVTWVLQHTGELLVGSAILTAMLGLSGIFLGMFGIVLHSLGSFVDRLRDEIIAVLDSQDR